MLFVLRDVLTPVLSPSFVPLAWAFPFLVFWPPPFWTPFPYSNYLTCMHVCQLTSVVYDSLRLYGLKPGQLLCPWDSPGKNTGVGCCALLQEIFLTQGLNPCLLCLLHYANMFFTTSTTWEALVYLSVSSVQSLSCVPLFATP